VTQGREEASRFHECNDIQPRWDELYVNPFPAFISIYTNPYTPQSLHTESCSTDAGVASAETMDGATPPTTLTTPTTFCASSKGSRLRSPKLYDGGYPSFLPQSPISLFCGLCGFVVFMPFLSHQMVSVRCRVTSFSSICFILQ
jgi:hypothetical protein